MGDFLVITATTCGLQLIINFLWFIAAKKALKKNDSYYANSGYYTCLGACFGCGMSAFITFVTWLVFLLLEQR
jgi:hypothetical protein